MHLHYSPFVNDPLTMGKRMISFIIPLFNQLAQTQAMLESLVATIPNGLAHEVILIDDFSTDGTRSWLASVDYPHIKTLLNPHNFGFAKANNRAVLAATGDVLALLNNDLLLESGWLAPMLHTLLSPTLNAGLVGNVQYRIADGKLDHAGVLLKPNAQFGHIQTMADDAITQSKALAVTGACILLRKSDFFAVGGFDENFVNGAEDIDLCFKLRVAGKGIYVANTSHIRHHVGLSRDRVSLQNEVNSRLLYRKWRPQIKQELARVWQQGLRGDAGALLGDVLDGLKPAFLATPFAAAQVMSENALLREEARWTRLLDQTDPNPALAHQTRVTGWARNADDTCYLLCSPVLRVLIDNPIGLDGFYVSGKQANLPQGAQATVTITVNGLQAKTFTLGPELHFNVGISHPVVLPGITNCIEVTFKCHAPASEVGNMEPLDPCSYITLAHLEIDNKRVDSIRA